MGQGNGGICNSNAEFIKMTILTLRQSFKSDNSNSITNESLCHKTPRPALRQETHLLPFPVFSSIAPPNTRTYRQEMLLP